MVHVTGKDYRGIVSKDWKGRRVMALVKIPGPNYWIPTATRGTIMNKRNGFTVMWDACKQCKISLVTRNVDYEKIIIINNENR